MELNGKQWTAQKFGEHAGHIYAVAFNRSGSLLASGGQDRVVKVFKFEEGGTSQTGSSGAASQKLLEMGTMSGVHKSTVESLAWDPSSDNKLCSASNGLVCLTDATKVKKKSATVVAKVSANVYCISYAGDGRHIAISGKEQEGDDSLTVFAVEPRRLSVQKVRRFPFVINTIAWAPDHTHVLVASSGVVDVVLGTDLSSVHSFRAHNNSVYTMSFSPDGTALAIGSGDSLVSVWDTSDLACIGCLSSEPTSVRSVSWDAGGRYLAWCCETTKIDIGEAGDARASLSVQTESSVNSVTWHPRLHVLAAACDKSAQGQSLSFQGAGSQGGSSSGGTASIHLFSFR